ncbi:MAG: pilus assembly protein N-terminal domain-containing protein [Gemmatimonadaceae bacterium]|nr:pilus assembly protein N-terminal domain-containing protein [Gemmatimonadaceae bacterium]
MTTPIMNRLHRVARRVAVLAVFLFANPARAQLADTPVKPLSLSVGRAYPLRTDENVTKVSIALPDIADVVVISAREVLINAMKLGETDAILWFADGTRAHYRITVHSPSDRKQIAIGVKFAEVRRDALRNLGVSAVWRDKSTRTGTGIFNTDQPIDRTTGDVTLPSSARFLTVLSDLGTTSVLAFLDAEEQRGNARLLAEPNIIAGNLESASFLAGGEVPVPVVQGGGAGGANNGITIQYREFGIRLSFVAEIISDSLIKLIFTPEVSSLDFSNGVVLSGFRIPAFRTRRITSTLDVRRDQSLIVSGLFSDDEQRVRSGVPLLKDIPILGALFSSSSFQRNESELVVVVTPVLIDPMNPREQDLVRSKPDTTRPAMDALKKRLPPTKKP